MRSACIGRLLIAALLTAMVVGPLGAQAPANRILFIGNSLTYSNGGLWLHLERFAASETPPRRIATGRSVVPGAFFKSLWEQPAQREAIRTGRYDVVVLQEDLPETQVNDFREYARRFVADVRQAGARPVLLMTWAYPRLGWISMAEIAQAHRDAAAELKVEVAPAGLAWDRAMQQRPTLNLYARDREHPSVAGTYLTTTVVYATVFAKDPTMFGYTPTEITSDDAAFLRRVAAETVREYRAR